MTARRLQLWGWGLFVVSALFFLAAAWRSGDGLAFLGALFFLLACFAFLAVFFPRRGRGASD